MDDCFKVSAISELALENSQMLQSMQYGRNNGFDCLHLSHSLQYKLQEFTPFMYIR